MRRANDKQSTLTFGFISKEKLQIQLDLILVKRVRDNIQIGFYGWDKIHWPTLQRELVLRTILVANIFID